MISFLRGILDQKDAEYLQTDLDQLQEWQRDWQMVLNRNRCKHIRVTNKQNVTQTSYNINRQILIETSEAKYL